MEPRPITLILLLVAAGIMDLILLLFGGFLLFSAPLGLLSIYGVLMLAFSVFNLQALLAVFVAWHYPLPIPTLRAHTLSIVLPLAYLLGSMNSGQFTSLTPVGILTVLVPSVLNWLTIDLALRWRPKAPATAQPKKDPQ